MKIGFDAKRFFNNFTGLGNYSRFIISALSEHIPENEYWLYSPKIKDNPEIASIIGRPNIKVVEPSSIYHFFKASSIWRSWGISREPSVKNLDLYHGLSHELPMNLPRRIKKVVTVHDLIFIRYPKLYKPADVVIYKAKVTAACRKADRVLATSMQTASDIEDYLKISQSKIQVVYQGCHPNFKKSFSSEEMTSIKMKYALPDHYILNVGTIEERKNIIVLIKALSLLSPALRIPVVVVGRETEYKKAVVAYAERLGVLTWISFLHNVSFADLPAIYQGARIFVYPSLFEGFGIPLVEALESSVPVITSIGSCFSEAAGPGSIYVDPRNEEELAFQLTKALADETFRQQMIITGKKHISKFTPDVISEKLNGVYKGLCAKNV